MEGRRGQEGGREMWGQTGGEREAQNGKEGYRRGKEKKGGERKRRLLISFAQGRI